jgi:hypothetical protein
MICIDTSIWILCCPVQSALFLCGTLYHFFHFNLNKPILLAILQPPKLTKFEERRRWRCSQGARERAAKTNKGADSSQWRWYQTHKMPPHRQKWHAASGTYNVFANVQESMWKAERWHRPLQSRAMVVSGGVLLHSHAVAWQHPQTTPMGSHS